MSINYESNLWLMIGIVLIFDSGVKVGALGRQNERNVGLGWLALTSIFGLCFMPVYLIKSSCYSLI